MDLNAPISKQPLKNTHHFHSLRFVWQHIPHTRHIQCRHCGHRPPPHPRTRVQSLQNVGDVGTAAGTVVWPPALLHVAVGVAGSLGVVGCVEHRKCAHSGLHPKLFSGHYPCIRLEG